MTRNSSSLCRRFLSCVLALCCLLGSLTAITLAAEATYPYSASITADANLRRSPSSAESNIIARIPKGTVVSVTGTSGNFLRITYDGQTGYIFQQYAEKVTSTTGDIAYGYPYQTVTTDSVNLRSTRSTASKRLATIPKGATITISSVSGDWAQVTYDSQTGYCMTKYLRLLTVVEPTAVPTAAPTAAATAALLTETSYQVLQSGSTGDQVTALQQALKELGFFTSVVDGTFGTSTTEAVIAFQKLNSLPMNGIADANLQALLYSGKPKNAAGTKTDIKTLPAIAGTSATLHDQGVLVSIIQSRLTTLGYYTGTISGTYDTDTQTAVKAFQKANGLKVDGVCGDETQEKLANAGSTVPTVSVVTATPAATTLQPMTTPSTAVRKGSSGSDAQLVQQRLIDLGYLTGTADGIFGSASVSALKTFQSRNGLDSDGVAGSSTYQVLFSYIAISADYVITTAPTSTPAPTATATPEPITKANVVVIRIGTTGDAVLRLQNRLTALGYYNSRADGVCMADDAAAIRVFQRTNGLEVDGVAGYDTQVLLYSASAIGSDGKTMAGATIDLTQTLRRGSTGDSVIAVQQRLIALGYLTGTADGIYGTDTAEAIYNFQKRNGLSRDGVAGAKTLTALFSTSAESPTPTPTAAPITTVSPAETIITARKLQKGDHSEQVRVLQNQLITLGYLSSGSADGMFGTKTYQAVRDFQLNNALNVDGIAGEKTLSKLNSGTANGKTDNQNNQTSQTSSPTASPTPTSTVRVITAETVKASDVIYEYWYSTVREVCKKYPYATVYDYSTGISWQVNMFSYGKHAEAEPLTAADTAKMVEAFGGNEWTPKAVWVIFADGTVRIATTHSMPHGVQHITNNDFPGHMCIHFPRTEAQVAAIGTYATSHQRTVDKGWAETQAMAAAE